MTVATGKSYKLAAIAELIALYRKLPAGRGDKMLDEVAKSVRYAAAYVDLLEASGGVVTETPGVWTDDDLDELSIPARDAQTDEVIAEMRVKLNGATT